MIAFYNSRNKKWFKNWSPKDGIMYFNPIDEQSFIRVFPDCMEDYVKTMYGMKGHWKVLRINYYDFARLAVEQGIYASDWIDKTKNKK